MFGYCYLGYFECLSFIKREVRSLVFFIDRFRKIGEYGVFGFLGYGRFLCSDCMLVVIFYVGEGFLDEG